MCPHEYFYRGNAKRTRTTLKNINFVQGGGKKLLLLRTFFVRHSRAGQPSVRSGNWMVAKGKTKETCL